MATAAVQNLIQESNANVHACVRHNVISSFGINGIFFLWCHRFPCVGSNTILEPHYLWRAKGSEYADSFLSAFQL